MDPYTLCPCGSGKKLKFCCTDLIGEIEKIHRMIEGDQPRGALRHVEQTLDKQPGRASLLDLKAMLQLSLGELEAARETVGEFLKADPQSPSAHSQNAIVLAEEGHAREAVEALQDALDRVDTNLPQRTLEALGAVGYLLMKQGDIVPARAHLWLYQSIMGGDDSRALELLVRMNQVADLPLVLRDQLTLQPLPKGHAVEAEMAAILQLTANGKWRSAAAACDELLPEHLDEPIFFFNRALLSGYLADKKNFVAGMRLYARQEIPFDDAVEAEAIAQVVDENAQLAAGEMVRVTYDVADGDVIAERLSSDERIVHSAVPPDVDDFDGPKPRGMYVLLDRSLPTEVDHLTREQVPRVLGLLSHYGKQTERAERIEILTDRDEQFGVTLDTLAAVVGDSLGQKTNEETVGPSQSGDSMLNWKWHFPPGTSPSRRRELLNEERRDVLLNRWPEKPQPALAGMSPREAASDPEQRLPLLASILLLEQGSANAGMGETIAELRGQLGLPAPEPISGVETGDVSLVYVPRVDLSALPDHDLKMLYRRAVLANASAAIGHIAREGLRRPDFHSEVPFDSLYEQLFSLEEDSADAVRVLNDARQWAESKGQSCARWDILELHLHLADNNPEGAKQLLNHLHDQHMDEPEVAEQVYELLYMIGAIPDHEREPRMPDEVPLPVGSAPTTGEGGGIWTPGSDTGPESKSKLWTPD